MFQVKLLNTSTFRAALLYLTLFTLSVAALLFYLFWNTSQLMREQTDEAILADILSLSTSFKSGGVPRLARSVSALSRDPRLSIYLLLDPEGRPVAGNLNKKPDLTPLGDNWYSFEYLRITDNREELHAARARVFNLQPGFYLLVGRDIEETVRLQKVMLQAAIYGLGLILILGIGGGLLMSRNFRRRIDSINQASSQIMDGDLSRRIPLTGSGDEIDQLAGNLNQMLMRIEGLMTGMREVTDNVAHDLRSPINRLRSRLEVTLMKPASNEEYRDVLMQTIEEADKLLVTFNALLSVARLEAGSAEVRMEELDITRLVQDAVEFVSLVAEEQGVQIHLDIPEKSPNEKIHIRASRPLLSQAVINLLDNALKYGITDTPEIRVAVRVTDRLVISVADNGPGIPPQDMARVTERFVRLDASRNRPGSGLGLSLVSAVAQWHGGELHLRRNEPQGIIVEIMLPLNL